MKFKSKPIKVEQAPTLSPPSLVDQQLVHQNHHHQHVRQHHAVPPLQNSSNSSSVSIGSSLTSAGSDMDINESPITSISPRSPPISSIGSCRTVQEECHSPTTPDLATHLTKLPSPSPISKSKPRRRRVLLPFFGWVYVRKFFLGRLKSNMLRKEERKKEKREIWSATLFVSLYFLLSKTWAYLLHIALRFWLCSGVGQLSHLLTDNWTILSNNWNLRCTLCKDNRRDR